MKKKKSTHTHKQQINKKQKVTKRSKVPSCLSFRFAHQSSIGFVSCLKYLRVFRMMGMVTTQRG